MKQGGARAAGRAGIARGLVVIGAVTVALLLTATSASAGAAGSANSRLSIRAIPGALFGYVTSSRSSCADNRAVAIFKKAGQSGSAKDQRVGVARAHRVRGGNYQWFAKGHGVGIYYAKARSRPGCDVSTSRTVHARTGAADDVPVCPGLGPVCKFPYKVHLDLRYGDSIALPCPNFNSGHGHCHGWQLGEPHDWGSGWAPDTAFDWNQYDGRKRSVSWNVYPDGGYLDGTVPDPGSAAWSIRAAGMNDDGHPDKGTKWFTPDQPGKEPGTLGGPFYIDFENAWFGADVYIWGYLFKKP